MVPYLQELEQKGFNFMFQYTILGYPRYLDQRGPPLEKSLANFKELANLIGPRRVVWRYDPIVVSQKIGVDYHIQRFDTIARSLQGSTFRCMVSLVDIYRKAKRRLQQVEDLEGKIARFDSTTESSLKTLMSGLKSGANQYGMELFSCAETLDLSIHGIFPGKCIDGQYLAEIFGTSVSSKKDPGQRKECGCVVSKDIGMYDSCLLGCQYCYATSSFERAKVNYDSHNPASPSLLGWRDVDMN